MGLLCAKASRAARSGTSSASSGVSLGPGQIAFTVIPLAASSLASDLPNAINAPLQAE